MNAKKETIMATIRKDSKAAGVYLISNKQNGWVYVGSALVLADRWHSHRQPLRNAKHKNKALLADWQQFGEDNFEFTVLEEVGGPALLQEREQFWINHYNALQPGRVYNILKVAVRTSRRSPPYYVHVYRPKLSRQWWVRYRLPPSALA